MILNQLVSTPPAPGNEIRIRRLGHSETLDLRELYERAGRLAARLRAEGIGPGDRIGVLAANCLEWVLLDLAALRLKAVTAGFESGKAEAGEELCAAYGLALLFTDQPGSGPRVRPIGEVRALAETGPELTGPPVHYAPGDATTLKFTSGSTGRPKGLAASAGSIDSSLRAVQGMFAHGPGDNLFVFLPLSLLQQRYWVYSALCHGHDVTISDYQAVYLAMRKERPTVVMGVPAFFEVAARRIRAKAERAAPGTDPGQAVREAATGLFGDRVRYLWTGSAPAHPEVLAFLTSAGLPIYEGYGLNETCIVTKNHPGAHRPGSVGKVVPGKEVLLDGNGVISVRSTHPVGTRYAYAAPGDSERMFGPDGTVRTGDLGHFDEDGFLYIRGRADDVLVLANGRKVIVRPIEEHLRASPAIAECVLYCPTRTHLVAVVSPEDEPADEAAITARIASANAVFGPDEQIRRVVLARRFTVANGLLTNQFKPRRAQILSEYHEQVHNSEGIRS